jgi:hypothetical protein
MAKKQKRERGATPFFSVKNTRVTYKTKNSTRTRTYPFFFRNGKRTTAEKIEVETGVDVATLEYLAKFESDNFDEALKNATDNLLEILLDLNHFEDFLPNYQDLEGRNISEFVLQIRQFLDPSERMPFLSALELEIDKKSKLVYFDFSTKFESANNGMSDKVTRGKSEFAIYSSN